MTRLGEVPNGHLHEHQLSSKGLRTVDLPPSYGSKTQRGSVDSWGFAGGSSRIAVMTDRVYLGGSEMVVPGVGMVDSALSDFHGKNLHRKGVIKSPVVARPHLNVFVEKMPEVIYPGVEVSDFGAKALHGGVLPEDPDVLAKAWEIFSYGLQVHKDAGLHLKKAEIVLGRFQDGRFTVVEPLFTSGTTKIEEFVNLGINSKQANASAHARAFHIQIGERNASSVEVAQAIELHFNPLGLK